MPTPDRLGCRPSRDWRCGTARFSGCSIITVDTFVIDGDRAQNKCGATGAWQEQWSSDVAAVQTRRRGRASRCVGPLRRGRAGWHGRASWRSQLDDRVYARRRDVVRHVVGEGSGHRRGPPAVLRRKRGRRGQRDPCDSARRCTDQRRRWQCGHASRAPAASICWISTRPCARAVSRTDRYVPMARTTATTVRIAPRRSWPRQFERPRQPKRSSVVDMNRPARGLVGRAARVPRAPRRGVVQR